jgi:hypothetical protein
MISQSLFDAVRFEELLDYFGMTASALSFDS